MAQARNEKASISTYADHEVITPPHRLRDVLSTVPDPTHDDPVSRAEQALALLSYEFTSWMDSECQRLDRARHHVKAAGLNEESCEVLFRAAHDIKGEAATFGFPWIAILGDSLCRLIEHTPDVTRIPLALVDQHVDAIRALFRESGRADNASLADALADKLREVTEEYLVHENRGSDADFESVFGPPLAGTARS